MIKYPAVYKYVSLLWIIRIFTASAGSPMGNYFFPEITFRKIRLNKLDKDSVCKVVIGLKEYRRIFDKSDILDTVNNFYSSDIDSDGNPEIIYYGYTGAEGYWTIIWKNDGGSLHLLGELYGRIIGIGDSFHISTLAPPCCGSSCGYANLYKMNDEWFDLRKSVAVFGSIRIPHSIPIRKKIVIKDAMARLVAVPSLQGIGNIIVELNNGISAFATAEYKDRNDNRWFFVVTENPQKAEVNVYKEYRKEGRSICGWLSAGGVCYEETENRSK